MNTIPATAFVIAAIFLAPSVAATPIQTRPVDTAPFFAMRSGLANDTLEFAEALQNAQSAEEASNITSVFFHSSTGTVFSQLCQYFTDRNLLNLTKPVDVNPSKSMVEWRLATTTEKGDPAVSYHRFKYDPNDLGCEKGLIPFQPGQIIETRTPDPLDASGEVMRLFYSPSLIK